MSKTVLNSADLMIEMAQQHREHLFSKLPESSAVLVASGSEQIRNRDVEFPFRAESDFFYLSGFSEPDSVLLLVKNQGERSMLFVRPRDPQQETWQGRRLGVEMAPVVLKVDLAHSVEEIDEQVVEQLQNIEHLFFSFGQLGQWMESVESWLAQLKAQVRKGISAPSKLVDLDDLMHEMRLFKSDDEIELMRQAAQISVQGHLAAMRHVFPGQYEFQLQAALEGEFMRLGSQKVAFNSIAASGDNACILHYTENSDQMGEHQLVLVDAGAEFRGYAGDITTTFPVSGRFTPAQKQLYELVLTAQRAAIDCIAPGVSYQAPHQAVIKILTAGLVELGLLSGEVDDLIDEEAYKDFFMHGTGHWLGMDVHDVGRYKQQGEWREFEPGMVLTVEPGLYVSSDLEGIDERWLGIGIRIEDDVLVTDSGCEVLTYGLPRTVTEIESWMAEHNPHLSSESGKS
ncbi:Xaa-Pro aminopeptidase [Thiomicrorhabdus chilensis]|uniref:Xaa-Pro aminopeptidase n=1 Tax=Thiomicrorhabdus chilensis TaxID=63656 RepID=UPI00040FFF36|nr:Xaa-Pro aminopeptidase [Thiomicrorhabdus chilensis]